MGWVQLFSQKAHYTSRAARGGCGSIKKKQIKVAFILCLYHVRKATSQCDAQTEVFVWPFFLVVHGCVSTVCSRWWCKNPFDVLRWVVHRFVMQRVHAPCPCHGFFLYLRNSRGQHLTPSTCVGKRFFQQEIVRGLCTRWIPRFGSHGLQTFLIIAWRSLLSGLPYFQSTTWTKWSLCSFIFSLVMWSPMTTFSNSKTTLWWPPGKNFPCFSVQAMMSCHLSPKRPRR